MCGLTGFIDFEHRSTGDQLMAMTRTLIHRGPDDQGQELMRLPGATVGLGFRRLSILDLTPAGHQPMMDPSNGCWIAFNGEIYNFKEIRQELETAGHSFVSNSDTEVILQAYRRWGIRCIDRFRGMFAIVLVDPAKGKAFLVRDRAGVKPLYYYRSGSLILFGSELKSFHAHPSFRKELDTESLSLFFRFGYVPAPYCIFRGANKLEPGHYLEIGLDDRQVTAHSYWSVAEAYARPRSGLHYQKAVDETEKVLTESFLLRMVADVPVGVFLSGGYDSSCVAALIQRSIDRPLKTFTIGFEEAAFDEADHARAVADHLGTEHHEYRCTYREAMDIIPDLPEIYDEPFGDSSAVPTTLVSRFARKHVTVALSADAGDELFAGYPRHVKNMKYLRSVGKIPDYLGRMIASLLPDGKVPMERADRFEKLRAYLSAHGTVERFRITNEVFTLKETKRLIGSDIQGRVTVFDHSDLESLPQDDLSRILAAEYSSYLVDDILQKVDRATMSASLEGREPFLDHKVLEWVATLPSEYKWDGKVQKKILKDIVHRHIPKQIMERPKMGFGIPLVKWMRTDLRDLLEEVLDEGMVRSSGVLDPESVSRLKNAYLEGKLGNFERLWFVFSFLLWYKKWIIGPGVADK